MGQLRRAAPTLDARVQGVNRSPMRLLASAFHSRDDCAPLFRAAARRLELCREGFEVGAGDGGAMQLREFFGVDDRLNFLTQALGDSLEADF